MAKRSPPIPFEVGSIRPCVELAAIAASTAFPPLSRICTAAWAASGWLDAATPCGEAATDRPGTGKAAARVIACLLYTSDAADERSSVDLGGRRIIKKKKKN